MNILDAFTGGATKRAEGRNMMMAMEGNRIANANLHAGNQAGLNYVSQGEQSALDRIEQGRRGALGYLDQGRADALGYLQQGGQGARAAYAPMTQFAERYADGVPMYDDALGLGGADGRARALSAFQANPGYQWAQDQALDGIMRRQNAMGMLAGGNTLAALQERGMGLANQEYGSWLDRLGQLDARRQQLGYGAMSQSAQGLAGIDMANAGRMADVAYNSGAAGANYDYGAGNTSANLMYGAGNRRADLSSQFGRDQAGLVSGMTDRMSTSNRNIGAAEAAGTTNAINFGISLANLAAGGLGSMFGGGGNWRPDGAAYGGRSSAASWMPY